MIIYLVFSVEKGTIMKAFEMQNMLSAQYIKPEMSWRAWAEMLNISL